MAVKKTYGILKYKKSEDSVKLYEDGLIRRKPSQWIIEDAQPHVCIKLKAIFPKLAKWAKPPFKFIDNPETCHDLLWFMERYPLGISEDDLLRLRRDKKKHISRVNELEVIATPDYKPRAVSLKDGYEARNYQIAGKDIFMKCKRLLVGDSVGLGKTLIGIISFLEKGTLPALVVVQTHLTNQWKDEIEKFTDLKTCVIQGTTPYDLPTADVYIIKYSCVSGWSSFFKDRFFKMVVFDEAQELRHNGTGKYNGAFSLAETAEYCLGLTATPIYNYGDEIYNVLSLIKPDCLGFRDDFLREWGGGFGSKVIRDPVALGTFLRENFLFLRRTREEVGRELPVVNTLVHTVGYDDKEVHQADELARKLALKVTSGSWEERGQASRNWICWRVRLLAYQKQKR